jgi:hypothetical protein
MSRIFIKTKARRMPDTSQALNGFAGLSDWASFEVRSKKPAAIFLCALCFLLSALPLSAAPGQTLRTNLVLRWEYPQEEVTNTTFRIYSSPLTITPLPLWPLYSTATGTNAISLPLDAQKLFFVITSSNQWGESGFSWAVRCPALPTATNSVTIE